MSILEYTAEDHIKELQDESYEIGISSGYGSGYDTGINDVASLLV